MTGGYAGCTVLVTGGAGFVGSHLMEKLVASGARVVSAVDNLCTGRLSNLAQVRDHIELVKLDLLTDDLRPVLAKQSFEILFHLAANANVGGSVDNPRMDFEKNAVCTLNVLEAVRDASPDTAIVHSSSATVYGEGQGVAIHEADPKVPVSPYGASKLAAEHYLRIYAQLYGLRTANARLFSVFGPRLRKQAVYDFMCKLRADATKLFIHGDGTQVRDMNYVANIADALLLLGTKASCDGESYNVASGEQVSIRRLAEMLCETMGLRPEFLFSGVVRAGETQRWFPDISRLRALGYEPRVDLRAGLAETVEWFRTEEADADGLPGRPGR